VVRHVFISCSVFSRQDLDGLKSRAAMYANLLMSRLRRNLDARIPADRQDLQMHRHWVWPFFCSNLVRLAALMILSNHVPDEESLSFLQADDCYLADDTNFAMVTGEMANLDGSYLFWDEKRKKFTRAGMASATFGERGKGHEAASRQKNDDDFDSFFYSCYPHKDSIYPSTKRQRGFFHNLHHIVGIGFRRNKMRQVVDLFQWTPGALKAIGQLKGKGDNGTSLLAKQYRVVCYCCEKPYDLALSPEFNVSRNPGMEWLLQFFGRKK
jgi:hypothetical protein